MQHKSDFRHLRVYQMAEKLGDGVWEAVAPWPGFEKQTLGRQLVRAADSIAANVAEGAGRGSFADNRRHVFIARGSLYETRHWLRRAHRRGLLGAQQTNHLSGLLDELAPALNAYLRSIGTSAGGEAVRENDALYAADALAEPSNDQ